jgi:uncharacterized protein YjiS (DUF1127 family)
MKIKEKSHRHHAPRAHRGAAVSAPIARQAVADGVIQLMARIAAAISHELRIRRDMRQLMAMDEHMLRDIGFTRAEIGGCVRYGRN